MPPPPRPPSSSPPPATTPSVQVFAPKPLRILSAYLPGGNSSGSIGTRSLQLAAARTPSPALSIASSSHSHSHSCRNSRSGSTASAPENDGEQMVRLYRLPPPPPPPLVLLLAWLTELSPGPSNDVSVLDDFLKLVRSNHSAKVLRHHPPPPNVSPLSFRGSASDGTGASASKSASGSGSAKKPWDGGSGIVIRLSLLPPYFSVTAGSANKKKNQKQRPHR